MREARAIDYNCATATAVDSTAVRLGRNRPIDRVHVTCVFHNRFEWWHPRVQRYSRARIQSYNDVTFIVLFILLY